MKNKIKKQQHITTVQWNYKNSNIYPTVKYLKKGGDKKKKRKKAFWNKTEQMNSCCSSTARLFNHKSHPNSRRKKQNKQEIKLVKLLKQNFSKKTNWATNKVNEQHIIKKEENIQLNSVWK